jgi:hypothetical protein
MSAESASAGGDRGHPEGAEHVFAERDGTTAALMVLFLTRQIVCRDGSMGWAASR